MGRKRKPEGFCCVCGDMTTSMENPLLTCNSCGIVVHGGCYGDAQLHESGWKCQVCEYTGEPNKTTCQLCCGLGGAMKMTDLEGWAHIMCALFIPEGRFGDLNKMEPILISVIPVERFGKICYICAGSKAKLDNARRGACIECAAPKCSRYFHVTCGQKQGLLCEDSLLEDSLPYVGYCRWHMMKLPVDSRRKRLPAYSPNILAVSHKKIRAKDLEMVASDGKISVRLKEPKRVIGIPGQETRNDRGDEKYLKDVVDNVGPRRSKRLKTTIYTETEIVAMATDSSESPVTMKKLHRLRKSVPNVDRADDQMHHRGVKRRLFTGPDFVHESPSQMQALTDNNNETGTSTETISVESLYQNGNHQQTIVDIKAQSQLSETSGSSSFPAIGPECSLEDLLNSAHGPLDPSLFLQTSFMTLPESIVVSQHSKLDSYGSWKGSKLLKSEDPSSARNDRSTRVRRSIIEATGQKNFQLPTDSERMKIVERLFNIHSNGLSIIYLEKRQEGNSLVTGQILSNLFADGELDGM